MIRKRLRRLGVGRPSTLIVLVLLLGAILFVEWRQKVLLDDLFAEQGTLIAQRQRILALERRLFLARNDEAEIVSAGRGSLVSRLLSRLNEVTRELDSMAEGPLGSVVDPDSPASLETLRRAVMKYRQSVDSEIRLLTKLGRLGDGGAIRDLRSLEQRLLSSLGRSRRGELLEMQLLEREFVATLRTSQALELLDRSEALRSDPALGPEARDLLAEYRQQVDSAMSDALALELVRSESSLRFDRLPAMFRELEEAIDHRLEGQLVRIAEMRRNTGWVTAALLWVALVVLVIRIRSQRLENLELQERVARLADGMTAFTGGTAELELDLPRSGRLGTVTDSFLSMADRIRTQIRTIRSERNRAEEALQVKSDFLARVSHELRTPLHGILGMAELLLQSSRDQRQQHLVESISRSGSTLLSVVNDLLDYSKLEAGKVVLSETSFDLAELCETELAIQTTIAHSKGLELVLSIPEPIGPVIGDPLRLGQVLTNLLGNAVKFTDEGFVELSLRRAADESAEEGGDRVAIELLIRDTGPGIPADSREAIFESFAQEEPVSRRKQGGTGLGLSIVRELLDLMGGTIRARDPESKPADRIGGPGVEFVCSLAFDPAPARVEPELPLAGRRLLLVEGHSEYAAALEGRLRSRGIVVESRQRASEVLARQAFEAEVAILGTPVGGIDPELGILGQRLRAEQIPTLSLLPAEAWFSSGEWSLPAVDSAARIPTDESSAQLPRTCHLSELERVLSVSLGLEVSVPPTTPSGGFSKIRIRGRILLAEDNPISRDLVQLMLEDSQCEVVVEENGRQAVERLAAEPFDLVLMDCHMPEMDGYEATRRIRQLSDAKRSQLPILALTASALDSDRRRCEEAGMNEMLSKPISQKDLVRALDRWLGDAG